MRVALWHDLPTGGGLRAVGDQVKGLQARGHEVVVFRPAGAAPFPPELEASATIEVVGEPLPTYPAATVVGAARALRYHRSLRSAAEAQAKETASRIGGHFDVLLAHPCQVLRVAPLPTAVRLPSVLYLQEPHRRLYEAQPDLPWMLVGGSLASPKVAALRAARLLFLHNARAIGTHERLDAHTYDRVLVNSMFSRESVLRAYGLEATVCYLGVDLHRFRDLGLPRDDVVLMVGSLRAPKNPSAVVRAVAAVAQGRPRLRWIANEVDDDVRRATEALAAESGVTLQIDIGVSDDQLVDAYARATAVVYAPRLEPFGYVPLEAAAMRTPVVALAEGGVRETVADGVSGVVALDEASLGAALTRVLADDELRAAVVEGAARLVAARWGADAAAERLERNLGEVCELRAS